MDFFIVGNLIPDLVRNERRVKRNKKGASEKLNIVTGGLKEIGGAGKIIL